MTSEDRAAHSPNLDTVLMVEAVIREHSGEYKKRALWENLPRKMMYQTYSTIIGYLLDAGRIAVDSEKKLCWIYTPALVKRHLEKNGLLKFIKEAEGDETLSVYEAKKMYRSIKKGTDCRSPGENKPAVTKKKPVFAMIQNKENGVHPIASMTKNFDPILVPAGAGKKAQVPGKRSPKKGFFGLLPDWKIDTQAFRDELRD
jgi:hypothetical protein